MKIGISLSGGGAKGLGHLGVLKALTEIGVNIDKIVGVSSGSIVGAFFAKGYEAEDILTFIKKSGFVWSMRPTFSKPGILNMKRLEKLFLKYFPEDNFDALNIPFIISATNLKTGTEIHFSSGEIIKPILGSCAIPFLFSPIPYNDILLADGGISNNMPTQPLNDCDIIIGSYSNAFDVNSSLKSSKSVLERSILTIIRKSVENELKSCDIVIAPTNLSQYSALSFKKVDKIYTIGYEYTISKAEEILKVIKDKEKQLS